MARSGLVEFASHSYDLHHGVLGNPQGNELPAANARIYTPGRGYETEAQFRRRIADDLTRSRELLANRLGRAPRTMVWPYGRYNGLSLDEARKAGFEFAFTLFPEPASIHQPMTLARFLPTNDPNLATMVNNIQFNDALPTARRLVAMNPAALWTGDDAGMNERLGHAIERLRTLGATAVVLDAAVIGADGRIEATWFPNRELPMRADILSRISWQIQSRAGIIVDLRLPSSAALATLGSAAKVCALFDDLGAQVSAGGLFIDDAPDLALVPGGNSGMPWEVRAARNATQAREPAGFGGARIVGLQGRGILPAVVAPRRCRARCAFDRPERSRRFYARADRAEHARGGSAQRAPSRTRLARAEFGAAGRALVRRARSLRASAI